MIAVTIAVTTGVTTGVIGATGADRKLQNKTTPGGNSGRFRVRYIGAARKRSFRQQPCRHMQRKKRGEPMPQRRSHRSVQRTQ
jgi:hypothetical protein